MNYYISYFSQLRNIDKDPTLLPISSAMYPPKWYKGVELRVLSPEGIYDSNEDCSKSCDKDPNTCNFLKKYKAHLDSIPFDKFINSITKLAESQNKNPVILVFERPDNPCSERGPLIKWFSEHGYELREYQKREGN